MWPHAQEPRDILANYQPIMEEITATAARMLKAAAALVQAAQQRRRSPDDVGAHGLTQPS